MNGAGFILLRNPKIMKKPLSSEESVNIIDTYRKNPFWKLIEYAPIMSELWKQIAKGQFNRTKIFDLRLGLTLKHHNVKEFITYNTKDFKDIGFERVVSPKDL